MNIGYVVQQFYPTAYGSGIHAYELTRELKKFGHEIHIITKGEPTQQPYEIFKNIHIHRILHSIHIPYYFPFNSGLLWKLGKKIIQKLDLDVIIGHGFESTLYFKKKKTIPFVYKAVGTIGIQKLREYLTWRDIIGRIYFPLLGYLEQTAIEHANVTIAISDMIKYELIATYKIPKKRIYRIYNGVNIQRFHPSKNYSMLERKLEIMNKRIILFVGRLTSIKGPQLLVQAIPAIIKKVPECIFLFIGDGPLRSYLEYMTHKLKIVRFVKFLGFISNLEVPKYFAMADLCIIPSLYEPFGLVALESLASGTPILSSVQGGLAEIHNFLGEFPTINPITSKNIVKQVITLISDLKKLQYLGKIGHEIVCRNFTWKQCANQTEKILEKLKKKK
ncbi:MAG: glycosyltransferase family 4 protein [Promethearchaeota archaeon]